MTLNAEISYEDNFIKNILASTNTIALVGLSDNEFRPSFFAANYLLNIGYKIIHINTKNKKKKILNQKVYPSLRELNIKPDMVDIFINSKNVLPFVEDAIKIKTTTIWLQLGVINKKAEKLARKANINFIMNRCPKIEYARLSGELGWAGINSKVFSNSSLLIKQ